VIWAIEVEYWTVSTNNPKMRSSVDLQKKEEKKADTMRKRRKKPELHWLEYR
jgi:hypothetical protein